jgi:predicted RNA-binding protein with TRAM domain
MTEIPDSLRSLFSATLSERGDSYVIEVPRTEVERDALSPGDTYRVGLFSPIKTDSQPSNDDTQTAKMSDSRAQDESDDGPPVEEGEVREVTIEATGDQGDGIAKVDQGYVIIVPGGYPGETLSVEIDTIRPNVAFGHALRGDSDG